MPLLGDWNWWAPRPLARLHARIGLVRERDARRRPTVRRGHGARGADAALARRGQRALVRRARAERRLRRGARHARAGGSRGGPARRRARSRCTSSTPPAGGRDRGPRGGRARGPHDDVRRRACGSSRTAGRSRSRSARCSAWRDGEPAWDALERPDGAAAGGDASARARRPDAGLPGVLADYEMRRALVGDGARNRRLDAPDRAAPARPAAARRAHRRLDPGRVRRKLGRPFVAPTIDLTIHFRAAPGVPAGDPLGARPVHRSRSRPAARGRRTASCGRATASCSPSRASCADRAHEAIGYLGLGSNVGDRRANLQAAVDELPDARRERAGVLVGLRHRAGRRGARPAASSSTRACGSRPSSSPEALLDACKAVERALGPRGRRRAPRAAADRRRRAAARRASSSRPSGCGCRTREVHDAALRARAAARARPRARGAGRRAARPTRWRRWATGRTCAAPARRLTCAVSLGHR